MTQYPDEKGGKYPENEPSTGQGQHYTGSSGQGPYTPGSSSSQGPYTAGSGNQGQQYTGSSAQGNQGQQYTGSSAQGNQGQQHAGSSGQSQYASSSSAGNQGPYSSSGSPGSQGPYSSSSSGGQGPYSSDRTAAATQANENIGRPGPLGLGMLAFTLVVLGSFYASFILPSYAFGVREAIAPILIAGGIVEVLAGMWAFRRNAVNPATIFTAYGGFLLAIGYLFLPTGILLPLAITGALHVVLGFFYLCWTAFAIVLLLGIVRVNSVLRISMALMALAFLILAIGHFSYDNVALLRIGGWVAIITGLVAWAGTALDLLGIAGIQEAFNQRKQQPERRAAAI